MKQVLQSIKTGATSVEDVPAPAAGGGQLLIATSRTLISAGTERMLVEFGKANWIDKARQQPEKVLMVLDKIKTDGLIPTIEAVRNKLDQPIALGYCNVGRVLEIGTGVKNFTIGSRVVSNAKHAEIVCAPINLCAKIPDEVSDDAAAFTVLAAIALQGIRLSKPTMGEAYVVTGLGLIGLITVQLLRAHGCRVLGIDFDSEKVSLAKKFGAEVVDLSKGHDPVARAEDFSRGRGVDAVIVTASTKSNEPVKQAAQMCRKRGRIILVGTAGLELARADFYEKELTFQVSCSYGPGRYDPEYEEGGHDYPIGFVRWTEQRNFEAVLDLMAEGTLNVSSLISHQYSILDAEKAYALVSDARSSLGVMLTYPQTVDNQTQRTVSLMSPLHFKDVDINKKNKNNYSFIGAGNYARAALIPAFKNAGIQFRNICSATGVSGSYIGKKYNFDQATTDSDAVFADTKTQAVVISTRHDSHAEYVQKGIRSQKHVFVEKPLCLTSDELSSIKQLYTENIALENKCVPLLMVGFNRRFAPHTQKIKTLLSSIQEPKIFIYTVNAGHIPQEHWTQDDKLGGGRLIGEVCHFVDLLRYLVGESLTDWQCVVLPYKNKDTFSLQLKFNDGSIATVHYITNGSKLFPKERLEIFAAGRVLQLDNFRKLTGFGWPGFKKLNLWRQNKGQKECITSFVNAVENGGEAPIPAEELFEVASVMINLVEKTKSC